LIVKRLKISLFVKSDTCLLLSLNLVGVQKILHRHLFQHKCNNRTYHTVGALDSNAPQIRYADNKKNHSNLNKSEIKQSLLMTMLRNKNELLLHWLLSKIKQVLMYTRRQQNEYTILLKFSGH